MAENDPMADFPLDLKRAFPESVVSEVIGGILLSGGVDISKASLAWVHYDKEDREIGRTDIIPPLLREEIVAFAEDATPNPELA